MAQKNEAQKTETLTESEDRATIDSLRPDEAPVAEEGQKYVVYHGKANVMQLTSDDFALVGVSGQRSAEWSKANRMRVPVEHFSSEALSAIRGHGSFSVPEE